MENCRRHRPSKADPAKNAPIHPLHLVKVIHSAPQRQRRGRRIVQLLVTCVRSPVAAEI